MCTSVARYLRNFIQPPGQGIAYTVHVLLYQYQSSRAQPSVAQSSNLECYIPRGVTILVHQQSSVFGTARLRSAAPLVPTVRVLSAADGGRYGGQRSQMYQ